MGNVKIIEEYTNKNPITMIGKMAGVCWGSDTNDPEKNYRRGIECLENQHGRTWEFPDVYMILDGFSARVIREWYTHIGGAPTRLQASTRYIDYQHDFDYITPPSINLKQEALETYRNLMNDIAVAVYKMDQAGVPREDSALALPLGMATKVVCKMNLRTLIDMSHQRLCTRSYHEYRNGIMEGLRKELTLYSDEWKYLAQNYFVPKCEWLGWCPERHGCGRMPGREAVVS